jgi:hypothetical protein
MNKLIKLCLTVLLLGFGNWLAAILFKLNIFDISIPFALVSIFIIYIFTNKGGSSGRMMDMEIQGQTGFKVNAINKINSTSFIFLGSLLYFLITLIVTFFYYKDYFIN